MAFVTNRRTQVVHFVTAGELRAPHAEWHAACRWRFGTKDVQRTFALPDDFTLICDECMPDIRRKCKAKFLERALAANVSGRAP